MIKARIAKLMDKEMDRKSFLVHVAAGAVAVVGATTAFRSLSSSGSTATPKQAAHQAYGYGDTPYSE